ncbi:hypothetical protein B566_EDAN015155 [Ephemera danica]|nr:hypothetical protein B566_EDAN015155 [Ephemera danica]
MDRAGGPGCSRSGAVSACGISLSLERLAAAAMQTYGADTVQRPAEAVVCALGPRALLRDAPVVAHALWSAGVRTFLVDTVQSAEEAQGLARDMAAPHLVLLRDAEPSDIRLRSWDHDCRFQERRVNSKSELVEWLSKQTRLPSTSTGDTTGSTLESNPCIPASPSNVPVSTAPPGNPSVNFHFVTTEKLAYNIRRRHENQITGQLAGMLKQLNSRCCLELLALSLEGVIVRSVASTLDLGAGEEAFNSSVVATTEKHARHRKYIVQICDKLHELRFEKSSILIMLYSLPDGVCRSLF